MIPVRDSLVGILSNIRVSEDPLKSQMPLLVWIQTVMFSSFVS